MDNSLIKRQAAIDAIRPLQTYKLSAGDDMLLVDKAEVQTELMMLPSVQPYTEDEIQKIQDLEQAQFDKVYELGKQAAEPEPLTDKKEETDDNFKRC